MREKDKLLAHIHFRTTKSLKRLAERKLSKLKSRYRDMSHFFNEKLTELVNEE